MATCFILAILLSNLVILSISQESFDDYYSDDYDYDNGQCIIRQCNQIITGRRLSYARALEIIQEEEYLDEADFDIIRHVSHVQLTQMDPFFSRKILN